MSSLLDAVFRDEFLILNKRLLSKWAAHCLADLLFPPGSPLHNESNSFIGFFLTLSIQSPPVHITPTIVVLALPLQRCTVL